MKYLLLLPLFLTSCTTLETLAGEEPTDFRAVYVSAGRATDADENVASIALSIRLENEALTGDIFVDRIGDDAHMVGIGARYFLTTDAEIQPYVGVGIGGVKADNLDLAGYGRIGVEWVVSCPWRLTLDWRGYVTELDDDSIVTVGLGWGF